MQERTGLIAELRRRNVFRMAGLYLVGAWLITQVSSTVLPMFGAPDLWPRAVVMLLAIGFFPAMVLAWVFELTPDGLKREAEVTPEQSVGNRTGRRMERMIVVMLVIALVYFGFDRFMLAPKREAASVAQAVQAVTSKVLDKSIAVLPFANTGGDPANEYLSDGMSEEMINTLGRLGDLKVIGRNSSFQFKDTTDDPKAIALKLGVAYLLEGSVQKAADKLRVGVQLVRAADGSNVWTQSYDREMKDIFAVQTEIATAVADQLQSTLLVNGSSGRDGQALKAETPPSGKVEAYQALLQGNFRLQRRNDADTRKAIDFFRQAVAIDPAYGLAWAQLGSANATLIGNFPPATKAERNAVLGELREAIATATRLAPDAADVHLARAMQARLIDHDLYKALLEAQRAVALAPQDARALVQVGIAQGTLGRSSEAIASYRRAIALDPLAAAAQYDLTLSLLATERSAEAEVAARRTIELQPQTSAVHAFLAIAQMQQGKTAESLATARREPDPFWRTWALALTQWSAGDHEASDEALAKLLREDADDGAVQIALIYAHRMQPEAMYRWMEHAREVGDSGVIEILNSPFLNKYKDDARFIALARKLGVMRGGSGAAEGAAATY